MFTREPFVVEEKGINTAPKGMKTAIMLWYAELVNKPITNILPCNILLREQPAKAKEKLSLVKDPVR